MTMYLGQACLVWPRHNSIPHAHIQCRVACDPGQMMINNGSPLLYSLWLLEEVMLASVATFLWPWDNELTIKDSRTKTERAWVFDNNVSKYWIAIWMPPGFCSGSWGKMEQEWEMTRWVPAICKRSTEGSQRATKFSLPLSPIKDPLKFPGL